MLEHESFTHDAVSKAASHQGGLLFNTTSAMLGIDEEGRLYDGNGRQVGSRISSKIEPWVGHRNPESTAHHQFVVICAGSYPKEYMEEEGGFCYCWRGSIVTYPWLLLLLQIQKDADDPLTCRRVGVGFIEARYWEQCKPTWETIVLV